MNENGIKEENTTWEEVEERAELMAAADEAAAGNRTPEKAGSDMENKKEQDKSEYEVEFRRPYEFDDGSGIKEYPSIDMSGLVDLTTIDGEVFDRVLVKRQHMPPNKFTDILYCKVVAWKVTGLPIEFFDMLDMRDMLRITAMVHHHFLRT